MNKKLLTSLVAVMIGIMTMCVCAEFFCGTSGLNLTAKASGIRNFQNLIVSEDYAIVRTVCDVDGDRFPDVIGANIGEGLTWYSYPDWGKYVIGQFNWNAEDIKSADVDSDGDYDVIGVQDNALSWYENPLPTGNPRESWKSHYIGSCDDAMVCGLGIADLNNDGKLDVVARQFATKLLLFLQNTPEEFSEIAAIDIHGSDGLALGDLDNDADIDIALNGFWLENPFPNMTWDWALHEIDNKWWNQSDGVWQDNNARVAVADLNRDGKMDVLLSNSEKPGYPISWYETSNPATDLWTEHVIGQLDYCHTLLVGDLNLDGFSDVVAAKFERQDGVIPSPYNVRVYYNSGDGLSWIISEVSSLGIYQGGLADIGSDGDLDIVGSRSYWKGPIEIFVNSAPPETNQPSADTTKPIANAGVDKTINEDSIVTLDGSASSDNVGITSYTWTLKDETDKTLYGAKPQYVFETPGNYTVTLTVKDQAGNSASDTVKIAVLDITPPIAYAWVEQTTSVGVATDFHVVASSDNVGIVSYEWDYGDGGTDSGMDVTHVFESVGNYNVTLTVKDQAGNLATDAITVHVTSVDAVPLWVIAVTLSGVAGLAAAAYLLIKRRRI